MRTEEMGCIDTDKGNGNNKALNNFYILKIYTFLKLRKMQRKLGFLKSLFLGLNSNNPNVITSFMAHYSITTFITITLSLRDLIGFRVIDNI